MTYRFVDQSGHPHRYRLLRIDPATHTPGPALTWIYASPHSAVFALDPAGAAPPSPFLSDPDADVFDVKFTGQHLTWLKGIGKIDDVDWQSLELLASPYAAMGDALQPQKIATWPWGTTSGEMVGAHDRVAITTDFYGSDMISLHTWRIPDGEHRRVAVDPTFRVDGIVGLWKDEALFQVTPKDVLTFNLNVYRVPFSSMTVVP